MPAALSTAEPTLALTSVSASVGSAVLNAAGNGFTYTLPTTDGPDGSAFVTVTASDDAGNTVSASFDVIVNNVAPSVSLAGGGPLDAGETTTLIATATDPGDDAISFAFDLNNDGVFDDATCNTCLLYTSSSPRDS